MDGEILSQDPAHVAQQPTAGSPVRERRPDRLAQQATNRAWSSIAASTQVLSVRQAAISQNRALIQRSRRLAEESRALLARL